MATAIREVQTEEVITKTIVENKVVVLTLSEQEAQVLCDIIHWIGGNPYESNRKYADSILTALCASGFRLSKDTQILPSITFREFE